MHPKSKIWLLFVKDVLCTIMSSDTIVILENGRFKNAGFKKLNHCRHSFSSMV